ncbi:helix-turn-helix domain-containing protein [Rhodopirellula sallentina]|uniref:Uncharacterized protein n=1 Tax=Rhodopirellula sallentina SM41 TaxID=1263870 RepID=M5TU30_9BACT|nr:hypothetical protein [Rhodopirellula sallentina]EMI52569.1 hypothetical protein RSSM_06002 [Rhodopirellula sallentina SM41]
MNEQRLITALDRLENPAALQTVCNDFDELLEFFATASKQASQKIEHSAIELVLGLDYREPPKLNHRTREIIAALGGPIAEALSEETFFKLSFLSKRSVENASDVLVIMDAARHAAERFIDTMDNSPALVNCQRESRGKAPVDDGGLCLPLTENDRNILAAMLELNATIENPVASDKILKRALNQNDPKRAFDRLRENRLIDAKRRHGRWLTERGREIASMAQSAL